MSQVSNCPDCTPETIIEDKLFGRFHEITDGWTYCHRHETFWESPKTSGILKQFKFTYYRFIPSEETD